MSNKTRWKNLRVTNKIFLKKYILLSVSGAFGRTGLVAEPPNIIPVDVVFGGAAAAAAEVLVAVEPNPNVGAGEVVMGAFPRSERPPEPKLDRPEISWILNIKYQYQSDQKWTIKIFIYIT